MPSSFSRFLDETELQKVRDLYLESLAALDAEDDEDLSEEAAPQPVTSEGATAASVPPGATSVPPGAVSVPPGAASVPPAAAVAEPGPAGQR